MSISAPLYLREDQAIIHAGVNNINFPSTYSWSSLEGGIVEANSTFTRPGGMLPGVHLGGPSERTDVTVKRQFTIPLQAFVTQLEDAVGIAGAWVSYVMLDYNKNPSGPTVNLTGILKHVVRTNLDANNAAAAFLGLVIAVNQVSTST